MAQSDFRGAQREFATRVLGSGRLSDAAVLMIETPRLPTAPLGEPKQRLVGEWLLIIGSRLRAGLERGDVVRKLDGQAIFASGDLRLAINGTPVASVEQARSLMARAGESVALRAQRHGERMFSPVRIG